MFRQIIKRGIQRGEFKPDLSPILVQSMVYGSIESLMWAAFSGEKEIALPEAAQQLTDMLYLGIAIQNNSDDEVQTLIKQLNGLLARKS